MKRIDIVGTGIPYYTFENLEESGLTVNAFTFRDCIIDGVPDHFFQPLLRSDSDPAQVLKCNRIMLSQFGTDADHLVSSAQKHTANIHIVSKEDLGPGSGRPVLESIDGLITNMHGIMLQTFGADCPSVFLLDPVREAIGLCHSGRKGTQQHIAAVMLQKMTAVFGTDPDDVLAAVSPGICTACYEVGNDVAEDFISEYKDPPLYTTDHTHNFSAALSGRKDSLLSFINGKYHINLNLAISSSLQAGGVHPEHIELSPLCTRCRSDIFYSFRAEGKISNENCALFMLK